MIFHPHILALMAFSLLTIALISFSATSALHIYRNWDAGSSGGEQLLLERKATRITKVLFYLFGFHLVSLLLFIHAASDICILFSGAMCAAGSLSANAYGFPVLLLKMLNFFLAGLWLILNHADSKADGHPLLREKYLFLFLLVPLLLLEMVLQALYFHGLHPGMVTSCCGKLYSQGAQTLAFGNVALSTKPMMVAFYSCMGLILASGIALLRWGKGYYFFAALNGLAFAVSIESILSFISVYVYQYSALHCPFCMFQKQYGYAGYLLYGLLFLGSLAGVGVGILHPFRRRKNLRSVVPAMQRILAITSVVLLFFFVLIATLQIVFSTFELFG